VRIQLDRRKMLSKNIEIVDIVKRLYEAHEDIFIVHNFINDARFPLVLRIHLQQRIVKKFAQKNALVKVIDYAKSLLATAVRGIEGIVEAYAAPLNVSEVAVDSTAAPGAISSAAGAIVSKTIYIIRTKGSNMLGLAGIAGIRSDTLETNSMHETCGIFGMAVARSKVVQEWCKILTDFVPSYFIFLTDVMMSTSRITPLNRRGNLMREPTNTLLNMGTGLALNVVFKAALNETTNPIYGLSAPLLSGQSMTHGTGSVLTAYDPRFVRANAGAVANTLLEAL
jgi:hypothetical protein